MIQSLVGYMAVFRGCDLLIFVIIIDAEISLKSNVIAGFPGNDIA